MHQHRNFALFSHTFDVYWNILVCIRWRWWGWRAVISFFLVFLLPGVNTPCRSKILCVHELCWPQFNVKWVNNSFLLQFQRMCASEWVKSSPSFQIATKPNFPFSFPLVYYTFFSSKFQFLLPAKTGGKNTKRSKIWVQVPVLPVIVIIVLVLYCHYCYYRYRHRQLPPLPIFLLGICVFSSRNGKCKSGGK